MPKIELVFEDLDLDNEEFTVRLEGDVGEDGEERSMAQYLAYLTMGRLLQFLDMLNENGGIVQFDGDADSEVTEDE